MERLKKMENNLETAEKLFGLVCEGSEDKIVSNNIKNSKIIVKELAEAITRAKNSTNKSEVEKHIEDAIKKCDLIVSNLKAAFDYSKEHTGGF